MLNRRNFIRGMFGVAVIGPSCLLSDRPKAYALGSIPERTTLWANELPRPTVWANTVIKVHNGPWEEFRYRAGDHLTVTTTNDQQEYVIRAVDVDDKKLYCEYEVPVDEYVKSDAYKRIVCGPDWRNMDPP